jgi:hypothetical protein
MPDFTKRLDGTCCRAIVEAFTGKQHKKFREAVEELYEVSPAVACLHAAQSQGAQSGQRPGVLPRRSGY